MTKRTIENQPFFHVLSELNATLPLEYAIRAARVLAPEELARLTDINHRMHAFWRSEGYTDVRIRQDNLVDTCWDLLQLGYPEDRNPTRVFFPDDLERIRHVVRRVFDQFSAEVGTINLPFSDQYRVCDLLNGNDIPRLITEIFSKKDGIRAVTTEEYVPLSTFVLSIRRPIPRYRGSVQQVHLETNEGTSKTHIGVMLDPYMSVADIDGAIHEFFYHYAIFRRDNAPKNHSDAVVNQLLMRWGMPAAPTPDAEVTQLNELHTALNGLYCWDQHLIHVQAKSRGPIGLAKKDVLSLYMGDDGEESLSLAAVESHYRRVKTRIDKKCVEQRAWQEQVKLRQAQSNAIASKA